MPPTIKPPLVISERRHWFHILFLWKGSVVPAILPRVFFCAAFSFLVSFFYHFGLNLTLPIESGLVPSLVLGLLLVFRTNTAYERFWEGRKAWGALVNTVRNMARNIWVTVKESHPDDRKEKIDTLRLLVAFAISTKLHLRAEKNFEELRPFVKPTYYDKLLTMNHPPLEIAFWIGDYLHKQYEEQKINSYVFTSMLKLLDLLVDNLGVCERILKTPIPLAYSIHLKQLLLIYCLTLPFQFVDECKWFTAFFVAIVSFTVFGIEEIGIEIENPFGRDDNDLPLDQICETMERNINDLITLSPDARHWQTQDQLIE
ncbi:MAG: hypothetical protein N5P05_003392 [Chroococcopsis gigantea SAG 12.99]|jgi:putative membrane protein|nr:hypothetical protein [Chlorogloea purpurea SAG 13.99]MDV3001786.1 hypothetical protein [Chroococcopsis gigantea SAG 12.99]